MRAFIRNKVLNTLGSIKTIGKGVHILNSHYISRDDLPMDVFYDLLNKLKAQTDFVNIQDAVQLIEKRTHINDKLIAFTFDDGFEECYTKIAPVLSQFNTNAALFLNPGFIDGDTHYVNNFLNNVVHVKNKRPMTWEMVKELHADGFVIGNHTYDHARLVGLEDDELDHQIVKSKQIIELNINDTCDYFAWTYGRLSDIDSDALQIALNHHKYVFSGDNFKKYYSFDNKVMNRRHIEGDWPIRHINYFLSKKSY